MKSIAYIVSTLRKTGPTNVLAGTVFNLDKKKFLPTIITLSPEKNGADSWKPEFEQRGIPVYTLNLSRLKGCLFGGKKLKQILATIRPDIVHTHCFRSTLFAALYLKAYKRAATIHCDYERDFALAYGKIKGALMSKIFSWALWQADARICCSTGLFGVLKQKFPHTKYLYVNNGVDINKFSPVLDKTALRRTLNLPKDKKIFIWAGVFLPGKDPFVMARAILKLKEKNAFFVFCGEGPLLGHTKELLLDNPNVRFTGQIKNIRDYFQSADFYVSTSLSESFHLTVYEAMACGIPVILTDIEAYGPLHGCKATTFFKTGDYTALAGQMARALNGGFANSTNDAVQTVRKAYSLPTMAAGYQDIYLSL